VSLRRRGSTHQTERNQHHEQPHDPPHRCSGRRDVRRRRLRRRYPAVLREARAGGLPRPLDRGDGSVRHPGDQRGRREGRGAVRRVVGRHARPRGQRGRSAHRLLHRLDDQDLRGGGHLQARRRGQAVARRPCEGAPPRVGPARRRGRGQGDDPRPALPPLRDQLRPCRDARRLHRRHHRRALLLLARQRRPGERRGGLHQCALHAPRTGDRARDGQELAGLSG